MWGSAAATAALAAPEMAGLRGAVGKCHRAFSICLENTFQRECRACAPPTTALDMAGRAAEALGHSLAANCTGKGDRYSAKLERDAN